LEEGALVCHLYRRFAKECAANEFELFESWIDRYVHNWSHCDGVSAWLVGACIANEPGLAVDLVGWTKARSRWKRRSAAVSLIKETKRPRHLELIFEIFDKLRNDPDDMVHKGAGWLLKETYPQHPEAVMQKMRLWKRDTTRLTLRYAAEKMLPEHRRETLAG
jgi:3-methyladenine DNA glycosylase AlkD